MIRVFSFLFFLASFNTVFSSVKKTKFISSGLVQSLAHHVNNDLNSAEAREVVYFLKFNQQQMDHKSIMAQSYVKAQKKLKEKLIPGLTYSFQGVDIQSIGQPIDLFTKEGFSQWKKVLDDLEVTKDKEQFKKWLYAHYKKENFGKSNDLYPLQLFAGEAKQLRVGLGVMTCQYFHVLHRKTETSFKVGVYSMAYGCQL